MVDYWATTSLKMISFWLLAISNSSKKYFENHKSIIKKYVRKYNVISRNVWDSNSQNKHPYNTISSKLFSLALEYVIKQLNSEQKLINIAGRYLSQHLFTDDIGLISSELKQLQERLSELKSAIN